MASYLFVLISLMKSQLSWPTVKGVVFDDLSQIEDAVDHAKNINETFKLHNDSFFSERSPKKLVPIIDDYISKRIHQ